MGEVVGAIAVVVTLLYLSVQLRENTRSVEHSIKRGVYSDAQTWVDKLIESSELTELYRAGMNGDHLSANDRLRFSMMLDQLFAHWNHAYTFDAFDFVDNVPLPGVRAKPGGAAYWKRTVSHRHSFHPGFVDHLDRILAEIEAGNT